MNNQPMNRRQFLRTGGLISMAAFAGCAGPESGTATSEPASSPTTTGSGSATTEETGGEIQPEVEILADDLTHPWAISVLPGEETLLVTERPGRLQLLAVDSGQTTAVAGVPDVYSSGQGGLLDVTMGPQPEDPWLYLTYSVTDESGTSATRLGRAKLDQDEPRLDRFEVLHTATPFVKSNGHFGSRVVFGPDGTLYLSVGDRQRKDFGPDHVAQDPSNELGTTLRLEPDGSIPADNPFVDDPEVSDTIFSYGHRNAQGMTVHPETGEIWQAEHGERDGDEINVLEAGGNYGWPVASYACHYGTEDPVGDQPDERPDLVEPVYYWPCGSGGFPPSGMTFYDAAAASAWQGDLFVGTLAGQYLGRFAVDGHSVTEQEPLLADRNWRIRAVESAPDTGALYVAVDARSAEVVRLEPNSP